jgi:hypothetical protein
MPWTFLNFVDGRGQNVIKEWLDDLPPSAKAKINARIRHLSVMDSWPPQWMKKLRGYEGLFELRVVQSGTQYRPLGCYGPGQKRFTFVLGALEQGDRIRPPDAFTTAVDRCRAVLGGQGAVCNHTYE